MGVEVGPGEAARLDALAPGAPEGGRIPIAVGATAWLRDALARFGGGVVVVVDYGVDTTAELARRPWTEWIRTYAAHRRGADPLEAPGTQDVTVEVPWDQLEAVRAPDRVDSQAAWIEGLGLEDLVAEGRRAWAEGAATGGLAALAGRSRLREAEALTDPGGLGAFRVVQWRP
jgi:SAM-dependent MidA family methyltransferase